MNYIYVIGGLFTVLALVGRSFGSYIARDSERRRMQSDEDRRQYTLDRYVSGAQNNWADGFKEDEDDATR